MAYTENPYRITPNAIVTVADSGRTHRRLGYVIGLVCSIAAHTTPYSLENIPSRCAAQTVLEVNAGRAAADGVRVGAPVRHKAVGAPVWKCPE